MKEIENKVLKILIRLSEKNNILESDLKSLFFLKKNKDLNSLSLNKYVDNCLELINEKTKIINENISSINNKKSDEILKFFLNPKLFRKE